MRSRAGVSAPAVGDAASELGRRRLFLRRGLARFRLLFSTAQGPQRRDDNRKRFEIGYACGTVTRLGRKRDGSRNGGSLRASGVEPFAARRDN